ncbi:unnamed protein product, partial [Brenthis ino]
MLDGVLHEQNDENIFDMAFQQILVMYDAKYEYKRDFFWRTWRKVQNNDNEEEILHYKCSNILKANCTRCNGGFWIIEEKSPPCPYEIFSLKSDVDLCVFNYNIPNPKDSECPSIITMKMLRKACDHLTETKWRITKKYNVPGNNTALICQGRDFCEVTTLYNILHNSIVFRLINSTNHIFHSKIMKSGKENYFCTNDCGKMDLSTKKVIKNDKPLSLDLLNNTKKKREDKKYGQLSELNGLLENGLHYAVNGVEMAKNNIKNVHIFDDNRLKKSVSSCKKLQEKYLLEESGSNDYEYY